MNPTLEIAANSVASALAAQAAGAARVELCSALELGGLTPSRATIAMTRERLQIPLYVLIRPRAGHFAYDQLEHETMMNDIHACVLMDCDGVVIGALDAGGNVDGARCRALIEAAGKLGVTFHRAFDCARDPVQALEDIIALGCERVLTSGQRARAAEGAPLIRQLAGQARGRIGVMAGAGIDAGNIAAVAAATGVREFHASAKRRLPGAAPHPFGLDEMTGGEWRSDPQEIRAMLDALQATESPGMRECER
ncbi:MAG: copper homeostasis protein CutC [Proteobacteria bacterium]|nr:copper homeostasis protein CutC [Pseudomonadota bacterium]